MDDNNAIQVYMHILSDEKNGKQAVHCKVLRIEERQYNDNRTCTFF
jgi:hypothetical protein